LGSELGGGTLLAAEVVYQIGPIAEWLLAVLWFIVLKDGVEFMKGIVWDGLMLLREGCQRWLSEIFFTSYSSR
jgi:hypothetical protein